MLERCKRDVPRSIKKVFINNGTGGVDGFISANSQPAGRRKTPYKAAKEYVEYKGRVKFSDKLDLSKIRPNIKSITQVIKKET